MDASYQPARLAQTVNAQDGEAELAEEPRPTICSAYEAGKFVVNPQQNPFLPTWDAFMILLIVVVSFRVPYHLGFLLRLDIMHQSRSGHDDFLSYVDLATNWLFVIDMMLQFFISSPHPVNHRWIRMPHVIVRQYLSAYFLSDLLSVIPYCRLAKWSEVVFGDAGACLGVLKLLQLLKLARIDRLIKRYESRLGMPYALTKLVKLIVLLFLSLHWIACSWGALLSTEVALGINTDVTWADALREAKPGMFAEHHTESPWELYTASLYWSCMTLTSVGYGDITAVNMVEAWCSIVMMGACGLIWANIIGSVCAIASSFDADNVLHENTIDSLNLMMKHFDLPTDDRVKLREFFQRRKRFRSREGHAELFSKLSPHLQGCVARNIQAPLLEGIWIFKRITADSFIIGLFEGFESAMYPPRDNVDLLGSLVYMGTGVALLMAQVMKPGSFWGVDDLLLSNPRLWQKGKALALSYLELQYLTHEVFDRLLQQHPEERAAIRKQSLFHAIKTAVIRGVVHPSWKKKSQSLEYANEPRSQIRPQMTRSLTSSVLNKRDRTKHLTVTRDAFQRVNGVDMMAIDQAKNGVKTILHRMRHGALEIDTKSEQLVDELLKILGNESSSTQMEARTPSKQAEARTVGRRFKL